MKSSLRTFFSSFYKTDYIFFVISTIAFYFLISQYIPVLDDFRYHFCYNNWPQPIDSFSGIIKSQAYHYINVNGRFLAHCFIQFFCGFGGRTLYFICSSLVFIGLLLSALQLIKQNISQELMQLCSIKYLFLLLLLLFVPQIGIIFFGSISFTINYMWSTMIYLSFLAVFFKIQESSQQLRIWELALLLIFGIICGSWQESFSIGISGAIGIYYLMHLKELKKSVIFLLIGFFIGAAIGIFSPANFARAAAETSRMGLYDIVQMFKHRPFFQSLIVISIVSLIVDIKKKQSLFIVRNQIYYSAIFIAFLFALIIAYHDLYQLAMVEVFATILTCKFIYEYLPKKVLIKSDKVLAGLLLLVIVYTYISAYNLRKDIEKGYNETISSILTIEDRIAYDTTLERIDYESQSYPYIISNCLNNVYGQTLHETPSLVTLYYTGNTESIYDIIYPEDIETMVNACKEETKIAEHIYAPQEWYRLIVLDNEIGKKYCLVESTIADGLVMTIKDKIMRRTYKEYKIELDKENTNLRYFNIQDKTYFIIPNKSYGDRKIYRQWIEEY